MSATGVLAYEFQYNKEGDLYALRNRKTSRVSFFEYDHAGRCMACTEYAFTVVNDLVILGSKLSGYMYEYDPNNNLTKLTCNAAGGSWETVYTYDKDNRTVTTTFANGKVLTVTYDAIGRVTKRRLGLSGNYDTDLTYVPGYDGSQTALLSTYKNGSDTAYAYAYDDNGNITSITKGTTSVTYQYNGANELIRENNGFTNQTVTYTYDSWGNLTEKNVYAYTTAENPGTPTSTITYGYSTGSWKDQLVSYDGQSITYDAMGNPTTYRGKALTWRGKQLTGITAGTDVISYTYDENGLRLQKTVNNVATDYCYNGSVLIGLVKGNDTLRFSYDAAGNAAAVDHNGTYYYYLRNGQGDIVKLIDGSGNTVVEYAYDSWGKQLSCTGTLATTLGTLNPFRYRGYVYDEETQWYYLRSRYYDPEACRFVSADVLLSTGQGVLGHNCYAYCLNNPARMIDIDGDESVPLDWWWVIISLLPAADGPLPVGDAPFFLALLGTLLYYDDNTASTISIPYNWPIASDLSEEKTESTTDVGTEVINNESKKSATFYGVIITSSGIFTKVTGPMTEEFAYNWVLSQKYGRSKSWGVYTQHRSDAESFAMKVGGIESASRLINEGNSGEYMHFHLPGHRFIRDDGMIYNHFHVWYGDIL